MMHCNLCYHLTINGKTILNYEELEQLLDNLLLSPPNIDPYPNRDYETIGNAFIRRLGQKANKLNLTTNDDGTENNSSDSLYLTCSDGISILEVQYFKDGSTLIGWVTPYYGHIYYYVNDDNYQDARNRIANIAHNEEMLCCDSSILRNIILYYCETGEINEQYKWIEDFEYSGPDCWHRDWLKELLLGHFAPEECRQELTELRTAQEAGKWQWGTPWPWVDLHEDQIRWENSNEMDYLEQLASTEPPVCEELTQHNKLLRRTARKLLKGKSFEQRDSGIRNLSFLRNCENLQTLDLRCNDIEDLSPIASLHRLKYLTLDFNLINDLSPLAGMEQLRELRLYGNKVHSPEPLRELHNLNTLILKGNPLEHGTLSCLRKCKRLGMLDLSCTGIQDLKDLEFCRAWSLTLYGNPNLTGLEVITTMKRLTSLHLDWEVARRYDIPAMVPHFTEYARYGNHVLYVWPEKFFD